MRNVAEDTRTAGGILYCIVAIHDASRAIRTIVLIQKLLAQLISWPTIRQIYVANTEGAYAVCRELGSTIYCDLPYREFSCWQEGVEKGVRQWNDEDGFLFANDSVFQNRIFFGLLRWRFIKTLNRV